MLNIQPKKKKEHKKPKVKMEVSAYSSRGRNGPHMAQSMKMIYIFTNQNVQTLPLLEAEGSVNNKLNMQ